MKVSSGDLVCSLDPKNHSLALFIKHIWMLFTAELTWGMVSTFLDLYACKTQSNVKAKTLKNVLFSYYLLSLGFLVSK